MFLPTEVIAETFLESLPGVVSNARILDHIQQTITSHMGALGVNHCRRLDAGIFCPSVAPLWLTLYMH